MSVNLEKINELEKNIDAFDYKQCDIFEDSLVTDRNNADKLNTLEMNDSCSSFSSHSGRDLMKKICNIENKEISLPSENVGYGNFVRNKYFDCSKQYEKELKKRKIIKKYVGNMKSVKIMDRSIQTSSSDADSSVSPTGNQKNEVSNKK